jgi:hypothetical protein
VDEDRFDRAIRAIDASNAQDPTRIVVRGELRPKELAHSELVTEWVHALDAEPDEALLLAARAHHLRRWTVPRSSYPGGRAGYLRWRQTLHARHADDVAELLDTAGYDRATIGRVQDLVRKRGLGRDPQVQVLEDALCLVFLETQLSEIAGRLDAEKVVDILRKTSRKMSPAGIDATRRLELPDASSALLERALAREPSAPE